MEDGWNMEIAMFNAGFKFAVKINDDLDLLPFACSW